MTVSGMYGQFVSLAGHDGVHVVGHAARAAGVQSF